MSTHALIPIHLDSLYRGDDTPVAEARLNFDRLPYFDGETDQNAAVPHLGEEIQSIPFRDADRLLPKGLHLHWLLPHAFTKGLARTMLYYAELTKILGEEEANALWNWLEGQRWIFPQIQQRLATLLITPKQFSGLLDRDDFWNGGPGSKAMRTSLRAVQALFLPRSTQFPAVPNRWVIRSTDANDPSRNQQRILASDYVHSPEGMVMARAGHGYLDTVCTVILENRSSVALKNVQIVDNLALSFPAPASDIRVMIAPRATGSLKDKLNENFTGLGDATHLLKDGVTLPAGVVEIITYTVQFKRNDLDRPVMDTVTATVDDAVHNGLRVQKTAADSDNAVPFPMHFREPSTPPYRLLGNSFLPEVWEFLKGNSTVYGSGSTSGDRTVTGTLISDRGEPIPGVNINIEGTSTGTVTDMDGNFSLKVPKDDSVLSINYWGFKTTKFTVGPNSSFDIILIEEKQERTNYLDFLEEPLTALGNGDPTFSSFYPNCKGVFGWYDRTVTPNQSEITYEVFGYYGDPEWDYFNLFLCDYLIALTTSTDPKYGTPASKEDKYPYCQRLLDGYEKYLQLSLNLDESKRAAMNSWMENLRGTYPGNSSGSASLEQQYLIAQRIKEELRTADSIASFPKQSLLYAKMVYQPTVADDADTSPHQVAIGNTGTQALAAYLSNELAEDPGGKRVIEEFLESVQFSSRLQHLESDVGARFRELQHAGGFEGSQGGTRWVVKPREHQPGPARAPQTQTEVILPDSLAHDLHTINATQRKVDRLQWQLESLKTQTYADWTKYMVAQYPPDVFEADYPDIDELRHLIATTGLRKIAAIEADPAELNSGVNKTEAGGAENLPTHRSVLAQQLTSLHVALFDLQRIEASEILAARATVSALAAADRTALETSITQLPAGLSDLGDLLLATDDPLPDDIVTVVTALNDQLEAPALFAERTPASPEAKALLAKGKANWMRDATGKVKEALRYNRLLLQQFVPALPQKPLYALQPQGNTRFWRPADPVVLLAGPAMNAHPRYGMQTSLRCPSVGGVGFDPESILQRIPADLVSATDRLASRYPFIGQVHGKPAHPLFIDWLLDYHPTSSHIEKEVEVAGYPEDYVTSQFQLTENRPSLRLRSALNTTQAPLAEGGHAIWGSTVLSSQGGDQLKQDLVNFLKREFEFRARDTTLSPLPYHSMFGTTPENVESWGVDGILDKFSSIIERYSVDILWWYLRESNDPLLEEYYENHSPPESTSSFQQFFQSFFKIYPGTFPAGTTTDRLRTWYFLMAMFAYGKLQESDSLAQALTGFNQALLMFKTGFQLDIADPLGFTDYQNFTREVARQIGNFNRAAVLPANAFFPIRAGALKLSKLRIIDSFGMEVPIKLAQGELDNLHDVPVLVAEPLRADSAHDILLPPSFVQPARLNFRWLAAQDGAIESNDHPASSPICGWVLLNEIDESLMIYSGSGAALGYIDQQGRWQVFPSHLGPVVPAGIENTYLRELVVWIMDKAAATQAAEPGFMETLFANLNAAIDQIEPSQAEHFDGISLLMSQPLALVRASVQVELKGDAAIHQGWEALQKELKAVVADQPVQRETLGFEKIAIPLRLGEQDQLNDGLVAFWVEDPSGEGYQGDTHFSPLDPTPLHIRASSSSQIDDRSGIRVSMLLDPRGSVHATTGILPVKQLQLDAQWYRDILKTLEVVFRTAPVLTRKDLINISLPREAGYDWSWVDRDKTGWSEITTAGHLRKKELEKAFPGQADVLWSELVANKSLTPLPGEEALITLANSMKNLEELAPDFSPKLGDYLRSRQIDHFLMNAQFTGRQVLKEGWLKLRQQPTKTP